MNRHTGRQAAVNSKQGVLLGVCSHTRAVGLRPQDALSCCASYHNRLSVALTYEHHCGVAPVSMACQLPQAVRHEPGLAGNL